MPPKVSVAIITYNQRDFLIECIESVLAQGLTDYEIVVADDGSTDGTQALLLDYEARHPELFKLVLADINRGITSNCNAVFAACSGEYIAWMGGDDLMAPGKIQAQVALMEADPSCALCYHDLDIFDSSTGRSLAYFNHGERGIKPFEGGAETLIEHGTYLGACSVMTRRAACPATGFDPHIPIASDWFFWIETAMNGRVRFIPNVLGRYRRHADNISQVGTHRYTEQMITLALVEAKYPQFARYARRYRARYLYGTGIHYLKQRQGRLARTLLVESLRQDWVSWKWLAWFLRSFR